MQAADDVLFPTRDRTANRRGDGSQDGYVRLRSGSENHSEVHQPDSRSMDWVLDQLEALVEP